MVLGRGHDPIKILWLVRHLAVYPGPVVSTLDLDHLDPPFNSNRHYNVIFRDESSNPTDAQLLAFKDTWPRGLSAEAS